MQKYNIIPLEEPSSKQCKYKSVGYSNALEVYTRYIANELAEANRLKRLELRILALNHDIPRTMSEVSEDRA